MPDYTEGHARSKINHLAVQPNPAPALLHSPFFREQKSPWEKIQMKSLIIKQTPAEQNLKIKLKQEKKYKMLPLKIVLS